WRLRQDRKPAGGAGGLPRCHSMALSMSGATGGANGTAIIRADLQLSPGTRLGPYELVGPLGRGGMGEVYRARDTRLGRDVAIKILSSELARDQHALRAI